MGVQPASHCNSKTAGCHTFTETFVVQETAPESTCVYSCTFFDIGFAGVFIAVKYSLKTGTVKKLKE